MSERPAAVAVRRRERRLRRSHHICSARSRVAVITALGVTQIFAWGSSYYLLAVLAEPIAAETGWARAWIVGGVSLGLLTAGAISPWVGRAIAALGGRPVLAVSAGFLAIGLLALALARSFPVYVAAWLVIGLGMGAGLYDPAFATLGRLYGHGGRSAITTLTLFGGFASTICWPLSALLEAHLGWRGACMAYAGFQVFVALPVYFLVVPREPRQSSPPPARPPSQALASTQGEAPRYGSLALLAATVTLASVISTTLSVHLLSILQSKGYALTAAVALGALVGPSQVAARTIEMLIARFHHPIWTKMASASLVAAGLAALWVGGADHCSRVGSLWRRHRPGEHRSGHAPAGDIWPWALPRRHGPHRHAEPYCSGGGSVDRCGSARGERRRWGAPGLRGRGRLQRALGVELTPVVAEAIVVELDPLTAISEVEAARTKSCDRSRVSAQAQHERLQRPCAQRTAVVLARHGPPRVPKA